MTVPSPLLLVISGLPAAGKTQLASFLARELRWPLVSKDAFKHTLHVNLPHLTRAQAGPPSYALTWQVAGLMLEAGGNVVLEAHFYRPVSEERLHELAQEHEARLAQVFCHAPLEELRRRHAARVAETDQPHIHFPFDHEALPPQACWEPLHLDGPLLRLDTTRLEAPQEALAWVRTQGR